MDDLAVSVSAEEARAEHPVGGGACDPEENCCDDCAAEYAAPEEER